MGEFELIRHYFASANELPASVVLGIGDDAALLIPAPDQQLVISVDTLVADVHFPAEADAEDIAQRALRVNLSDLAAMGATPAWFTLALTLPAAWSSDERRDWVEGFSRGLRECAKRYECTLVGGDTTAGPLSITLQVMGQLPPGQALRRDGAAVDDFILVTNTLGDGAAALAQLTGSTDNEHSDYLHQRFYRPEPQLAAGQALRGIASAALDISDGLLADLGHLCQASDVAAEIDVASLPVSAPVAQQALELQRHWALSGGDDYQLLFTVAPAQMSELAQLQAAGKIQASVIGRIGAGSGVHCTLEGHDYPVSEKGYTHFER
ncbi:MAG TPA: thiamine-phosphate kinase [Cellvibrionaceae bacterium]